MDELGPWEGSIENIGAEDRPESPVLQVRDLDVFCQANLVSTGTQPIPELDILDARASIGGIEAAARQKHRAANCSAATPEGRRGCLTALMDEMVEEVPILRQQVALGGLGIVGAKRRGDRRILFEQRDKLGQGVRSHEDVGVD